MEEFERKRVPLAQAINEAAEEESRLKDERIVIHVEQTAEKARFEAKRKKLLADLRQERKRVLADLKAQYKTLSYKIRGARDRQRNAQQKINSLVKRRDARLAKLREETQECDLEESAEEPQPELDRTKRILQEEKLYGEDMRQQSHRSVQVREAYRALSLPNRIPETQEEGAELITLRDLLYAISKDQTVLVQRFAPQLLKTSLDAERVALETSAKIGLPGIQALYTAMQSPLCSCRTLTLLAAWVDASKNSDCYQIELFQEAWVAGFKGLQWPPASARMPKFLPHSYTPSARVEEYEDQGLIRYKFVPETSDALVDLTQSPGELAQEPFEAETEEVQRLVNHASKLTILLSDWHKSYFYYEMFTNRPRAVMFEEHEGRPRVLKVVMTDAEVELLRRVVKTFLRI